MNSKAPRSYKPSERYSPRRSGGVKIIVTGVAFALLWPSAATASKIALESSQPFVISVMRFFIAGLLMLFISHVVMRKRLPEKKEWQQLAVYGLLNVSLYLGIYIFAMQFVSAGLGSLAIATNPVFISVITAFILRKPVTGSVVISLVLCLTGVLIAAWPLFVSAHATPAGLGLLILSMLIYSFGVIYFSEKKWNDLHILTINGWQTMLGGLFLFPVMLLTFSADKNHFSGRMIGAVLWLAVPVSILAVQLWLYLLRDNPLKASFWLFLCPLAGFAIANIMVDEPITVYTLSGMSLVIIGLYLVQRSKMAH